jgi:hypothetical protein
VARQKVHTLKTTERLRRTNWRPITKYKPRVIRTFGAKKSGKHLKPRNLKDFPIRLTETGKATDDNHLQPPCTKSADDPQTNSPPKPMENRKIRRGLLVHPRF